MIRLDKVSKRYPGQDRAAVDRLSLDVRAGETVVLLGPSGCGKTTTLRLINRLIEPTEGRILLDGEDVTRVNPDRLRRRIGYVIQQVGLFPHMTVADNIGLIPRTLGWDKRRVRERVDHLLDLVGLDPAAFRRRYPKELSGGQQQRIGVARALAADPPVMLMDEPFGAIDPITRERLQSEFLGIQAKIRKTIVLVTHDVAEAVRLGDRIAVFTEGARIAQYDTPARILAAPADEFVASFLGDGTAIRGLRLAPVGTLALDPVVPVPPGQEPSASGSGPRAVRVDAEGRVLRWPGPDGARDLARVRADQTLYDALDAMLRARQDTVAVVDESDRPLGALTWASVLRSLPAPGGAS
ncbi:ABC transporter ATP-binding protein [Streptomyces sp. DSM 44917]|uniref:ABC transporter ATP-binding protein n=2 Tax=Streptomyces boetiae TaxID=3075541 RepID=A0ABU2LE72_9ACTN|nr:ABC transporter ATP-binding protein [Streptomyces sp. DSM 44917]MDT0309553.1 ABC transporter ATP-binding protein [Streptomyces sp. DSM 44917]